MNCSSGMTISGRYGSHSPAGSRRTDTCHSTPPHPSGSPRGSGPEARLRRGPEPDRPPARGVPKSGTRLRSRRADRPARRPHPGSAPVAAARSCREGGRATHRRSRPGPAPDAGGRGPDARSRVDPVERESHPSSPPRRRCRRARAPGRQAPRAPVASRTRGAPRALVDDHSSGGTGATDAASIAWSRPATRIASLLAAPRQGRGRPVRTHRRRTPISVSPRTHTDTR